MLHTHVITTIRYTMFSLSLALLALLMKADHKVASAIPASQPLPAMQGQPAVNYLKQHGLYDRLQASIAAHRYEFDRAPQASLPQVLKSADEVYQASNPAQHLAAYFSGGQMVLEPAERKGARSWQAGMKLRGYGYGKRLQPVTSGVVTAKDNRLEIQKAALNNPSARITEWYINRKEGLEQGFTLTAPPGVRGAEPLRLALEVTGGLQASLEEDGQAVALTTRAQAEVLRYDHLSARDALGRNLPAQLAVEGDEVSLLVDDTLAVYPVTIDPLFTQVKKLTASDAAANDEFGYSVGISADTVVVGADLKNSLTGAAYIFARNQGGAENWGQVKKLTASDAAAGDQFGVSVGISADTVVVGANLKNSVTGAAYIFGRNQGGADNWGQVKKLTASDGASGDQLGWSVGISNDTVVVGAWGKNSSTGAAYSYERNQGGANNWGQVQKLTASDGATFDDFGFAVGISADTVVVGAKGKNSATGAAYIFKIFSPPSISKAFNPTAIQIGGTSTITFTLTNPNSLALSNANFTDTLTNMSVASTSIGGTCSGVTNSPALAVGATALNLTVPSLAAGSCTITVQVTSSTPGTQPNQTSGVTTTQTPTAGAASITANLTVVAPPSIAKSFNPTAINIGGTSQLTLTITNPAGNVALSNLAVTDPLPTGVTVAATPGLVNTCNGSVTGATAGSTSISLNNGTLAAGPSSCQVQVNVTSSTPGAVNNTTGNVMATGSSVNVTGNTASAPLTVNAVTSTPVITLFDPFGCTGSGDVLTVTVVITNTAVIAQPVTFTATLPAGLVGLPGTGTSTVGSPPTVSATSATYAATLAAGQSATVTYQVQVGDVASGATLCINTTSTFSGAAGPSVQACATINCPAVGPGLFFPSTSEVSDQKAGSVLVYNLYSSSIAAPNQQNTRVSITNTNPGLSIAVHLFFVDGATCSIADSLVCLTPNQTASFLASDIDPGTTGYIVAVASDLVTGCPVNFNYLIGDEYVKLSSGHAANLAAESFAALAGGLPACNGLSVTALLSFDGASYNRAPRVLAASNVPSRANGNDTLIVLNRFGGSLAAGASTLGSLFGILYDDAENPLSFTFTAGVCQFRSSLSSSFPRVAPRFEQFIPAGRSGWAKFYSQSDVALLGAQLNFNANAGTAANAFNQGHNLHKLTLTTTATLTIPIFPPNC